MRKRFIIALLTVSVLGLTGCTAVNRSKGVFVDTLIVSKGAIVKEVRVAGGVEAVDHEEIRIDPGLKVLKLHVSENQVIDKGQVLVELDSDDAAIQLEKVEINLEQLQQEMKELKEPETVSGRQAVVNRLTKAEIIYKSLERKLSEQSEKVKEAQVLFGGGGLSENDYKAQISIRDDISEQLIEAEVDLINARNEYQDYDINKIMKIQEKMRQIAAVNADRKSLVKKLEDSIVKSSIAGKVVQLSFKEGRMTDEKSTIRVFDTTGYIFKASVIQEDAVLIKKGQTAVIRLKGLDREYDGVVADIKPFAVMDQTSASRTPKVELELEFRSKDESLTVGFDAEADIMVGKVSEILAIPREALRKDRDGQSIVYVVEAGRVKAHSVTTGLFDDYYVEVKSGISEGQLILSNPPEELKDGDLVRYEQR